MKLLWLPVSLALACVLSSLAVPTSASAGPSNDMAGAINIWRIHHGLAPLRVSPRLRGSANRRAGRMISRDVFAHPSSLRVPGFRRVGEVLELHGSRRPYIWRTLKRWAASPSHRRVLLSTRFTWVGPGRATGRFNGRRATIWVVRVGKRR